MSPEELLPQEHLPGHSATLAAHPAPAAAQRTDTARLSDSQTIEGPIPDIRDGLLTGLRRNLRRATHVEGTARRDEHEIPGVILREAVGNALVHRDLSPVAIGWPIRVEIHADHIEIINPGGLYGPITIDQLGQPGLFPTRNRVLVDILEDVDTAEGPMIENRGTGIRAMREAARLAAVPAPSFVDEIASFRVTLHRPGVPAVRGPEGPTHVTSTATPRQREFVELLQHHGTMTRAQLESTTGLGRAAVQRVLRQLRDAGLVETTAANPRAPDTAYRLSNRGPAVP